MVLVASFAFAGAPAAEAAVKKAYVSTSGTGGACSKPNPCSISTALATATPGTKILLADGTYDAQLTVTTSDLTIQGISQAHESAVIIRPGPTTLVANATKSDGTTPVEAIIGVSPGTTGVTIANLTIDGSLADLPACTGTSFAGIEYHDASGTVSHVHVQHTQPASGITGCQVGDAIYVASTSGTSTVSITSATVDTYNKNGITCKGSGTTCTISKSKVIGTSTPAIAQNGIQFSADAGGSIDKTSVASNTHTGDCECASAILIYQAADGVSITNSKVTTSDNNIYGFESDGLTISATTSSKATWDGLTLDSIAGVTVTGGSFSGNGEYGIGLYGATNASISGTTTSKNVEAGIYLEAGSGNSVAGNTLKTNQGPGIWATASANGNTFDGNTMRHNAPDAQDDVGGNTWTGNDCITSTPVTGLCQ
jgi:parallel beta-helix repeat protein